MFHHDPKHTGFSTSNAPETEFLWWSNFIDCSLYNPPAISNEKSIDIDMIPDNPPIEVLPGENFTYTCVLTNNLNESQTIDVWIMLRLPNGEMFGPIQQFNEIPLAPHETRQFFNMKQDIVENALLGEYKYIAYCGTYPDVVINRVSFNFTVISQPLWAKTFGGRRNEQARCVQQTTDNGYIIAGWTESFGAGGEDIYAVKTDNNGNLLWERTYGGRMNDRAYSLQQTTDGGFIIVGRTKSFGDYYESVYLVKTNELGIEEWNRTYGENHSNGGRFVQETFDGGYIIAGWTGEYMHDNTNDIYLIKTDNTGTILWSHTYGGPLWDKAHTVQQTRDGGYIIAGITRTLSGGILDGYLIKTDAFGDIQWTRSYIGRNWDECYAVRQTHDGGYIISGGTRSFSMGNMDMFLLKIDAEGSTTWAYTYGGIENEYSWCVEPTNDGGYVFCGHTQSFGSGYYDVYLVKTDEEGKELWNCTVGGRGNDTSKFVQQTIDGSYIVAGSTKSIGAGDGDFWLLKLAGEQDEPEISI